MNEQKPITIRPATMTDAPGISRLNLNFESEYVYRAAIEDQLRTTSDEVTIAFQKVRLPKQDTILFQYPSKELFEASLRGDEVVLAMIDNTPVGFLHLDIDAERSCLRLSAGGVTSDQRKAGVGLALLNYAETTAKKLELKRITVALQSKNAPAIAFIQKQGYRLSGYEEFYFPNLELALFFTKMIR